MENHCQSCSSKFEVDRRRMLFWCAERGNLRRHVWRWCRNCRHLGGTEGTLSRFGRILNERSRWSCSSGGDKNECAVLIVKWKLCVRLLLGRSKRPRPFSGSLRSEPVNFVCRDGIGARLPMSPVQERAIL